MHGSLVPLRTVIIMALLIVLILFGLGYLYWNKTEYKCFNGKRPYGEWVTVFSISKFEVRLKPFGCKESDRYDPKQFKPLY